MVTLWNALPDSIHYAGMALLDASSVLHTLVTLWSWLSGHTLFEDGSIGTYAAFGLMLGASPTGESAPATDEYVAWRDDARCNDCGARMATMAHEAQDGLCSLCREPQPTNATTDADTITTEERQSDGSWATVTRVKRYQSCPACNPTGDDVGTGRPPCSVCVDGSGIVDTWNDRQAIARQTYALTHTLTTTDPAIPSHATHGIGYDLREPRAYATIVTPADWEPYPALIECPNCDYGEAGYVEQTTRDGVFWPVGTCERCTGSGYVWEEGSVMARFVCESGDVTPFDAATLPPRDTYGSDWIVVDADSIEAALIQADAFDHNRHPAQVELELFAAAYRAGALDFGPES